MIPNEFIEYLLAAGYQPFEGRNEVNAKSYFKSELAVIFIDNRIDVMVRIKKQPLQQWFTFGGISQLDIFKFMLLCHITGVVHINQVLKEVRKDSRLHPLIEDICNKFHFIDTKESLQNY